MNISRHAPKNTGVEIMKVIMTGGGTGGHIYPAIAIADEIKRRFPDAEILFVGAQRGLEKKLATGRWVSDPSDSGTGIQSEKAFKEY